MIPPVLQRNKGYTVYLLFDLASSEVTLVFCRVPFPGFRVYLSTFMLTHLCWFTERR